LRRRGFVLAFHSHNIAGREYATNDHVALDHTLQLVGELGIPVLRLLDVVARLRGDPSRLPERFVSLTFDDGTDYDWKSIAHPDWGVQDAMGEILRRHSRKLIPGLWLQKAHATSFVIASPQARQQIMRALQPVQMSEDWWPEAQRSALMDIGVHGWNHVHPSVDEMQASPDLIERFDRIRSPEQALLQVDQAVDYIGSRARGDSARIFAYPYGQVSDYLADTYFPAQDRILAAFTTEGVALEPGMDRWRLPRLVCGWHWKEKEELRHLLLSGP
jgi:peptidoglycan/xylan/chitin deacetylase (PgdA/CDA1 family)